MKSTNRKVSQRDFTTGEGAVSAGGFSLIPEPGSLRKEGLLQRAKLDHNSFQFSHPIKKGVLKTKDGVYINYIFN